MKNLLDFYFVTAWEGVVFICGFVYDDLNRLPGTVQKQKSGTSWAVLPGNYLEKGFTYDRNGNIKTLQRTAGGATVDNLVYSYTGNQLTGLTENTRTSPTGDIYSPGSAAAGSYAYDKNGNMTNDSLRALNLSYNVLNLLSEVKTGSTVKTKYIYLADGTKLRVRDHGEVNGFDYLGSLTYRKSSAGLQLESANFGDGVIRANVSNSGGTEVNYFLTDHLGSVRVIVDGSGVVKERNDYYPFGARHVRGDYPQLADNRYKYNGKEEQVTGDLEYLDYGVRMYDSGLGRWFGIDILSEYYLECSPYHFSGNNPMVFVDDSGMDYWSTNNPSQIASFLWSLMNGSNYFDFYGWNHATDAEFTGNLTYNDETGKFYTYYGSQRVDGEALVVGLSFSANIFPVVESMPYQGAFVRNSLSGFWQNVGYYTGIGGYDSYAGIVGEWKVSREGRLTGIKPIELIVPDIGIGKGGLLKAGKVAAQASKTVNNIVNLSPRAKKLALKLKINMNSPTAQQVLNNLDVSVETFISKFRKSSIRRVMPGEYLNMTVEEALSKGSSTVSKLLTDGRFSK